MNGSVIHAMKKVQSVKVYSEIWHIFAFPAQPAQTRITCDVHDKYTAVKCPTLMSDRGCWKAKLLNSVNVQPIDNDDVACKANEAAAYFSTNNYCRLLKNLFFFHCEIIRKVKQNLESCHCFVQILKFQVLFHSLFICVKHGQVKEILRT